MKKHAELFALILAAMACLVCFSACAEEETTVLMYMCGADIQEDACWDIYEMALAETNRHVNLVLLAGGAEEWEFDELRGGTRNLAVIRDGDFEFVKNWGKGSMGSEESLLKFLKYGMTEYPADRMIVILWNHGAGSEGGICFDEVADEDSLTLVEINSALYDLDEELGGFHIDVFGCDACMMATYEMAAMLCHYDIDCFVASEELEPWTGWHYTPWLAALEKKPGISTEDLCALIVDSFVEAALDENPDEYVTLSAISLPKIRELEESMEEFAAQMGQELQSGGVASIRRSRSRMYTFGSFDDGSWDMVDLGAVLDAYAHLAPDTAAMARRQLEQAVIFKRQSDNLDPCSGLSILMPQDTVREFSEYSAGLDISFYIPNWMDFVKGYAKALGGGQYSFSASTPQQVTDYGAITGWFSCTDCTPGGAFEWNSLSQTYEEAQEAPQTEITVGDGSYAFSASLSDEDMQYLDYVEGMLMMDISDDEMIGYIDFGLMQNNLVDWEKGMVYSLFDGTWPVFGEQMVPLYDQSSNAHSRRSLIPVKLNGSYTYLVAVFSSGNTEGRIIGANAGYDDNGLPIRSTQKLKNGDVIIPVYTVYYAEDEDAELEEMEMEGDEIIWKDGMTVTYEDLSDDEPLEAMFCFVFNDIFGDYTMSEIISFEI